MIISTAAGPISLSKSLISPGGMDTGNTAALREEMVKILYLASSSIYHLNACILKLLTGTTARGGERGREVKPDDTQDICGKVLK